MKTKEMKRIGKVAVSILAVLGVLTFITQKTFAVGKAGGGADIVIHKVENNTTDFKENNGIDAPAGLDVTKPLSGAVFTVVDVSADFYTYATASGKTFADAMVDYKDLLKHESNQEILARGTGTPIVTSATDASGKTTVSALPERVGDKNAVYAIIETTRPKNNVTTNQGSEVATSVIGSIPTIISLPWDDPNGPGYLAEIHLYPKNEIGKLTKELVETSDKHVQTGQQVAYHITINLPNDLGAILKQGPFKYQSFTVNDFPKEGLIFNSFDTIKVGNGTAMSIADFETTYDVVVTRTSGDIVGSATAKASLVVKPNAGSSGWASLGGKTLELKVTGTISTTAKVDQSIENDANYVIKEESGLEIVPGEDGDESFTHQYVFQKNDSETGVLLKGAVFTVSTKNDGAGVKFRRVADGVYEADPSGISNLTVNSTNGTLVLLGLDSDITYVLTEVTAPSGYRLNNWETEFTPSSTKYVSSDNASDKDIHGNKTDTYHNIYNVSKNVLPSTGGKGFILYTAIALVAAGFAVFFLVIKRKVHTAGK